MLDARWSKAPGAYTNEGAHRASQGRSDRGAAKSRTRHRVESASSALHSISAAEARGKTANVVNVAIAREMVSFIWSIACTVQSASKDRMTLT